MRTKAVLVKGDDKTWWYACDGCRGVIDYMERICPHCQADVGWACVEAPKNRKIYTGEQTEPAE